MVSPHCGIVGIMELVLHQDDLKASGPGRENQNWPTFLSYRKWSSKSMTLELEGWMLPSFTLANFFGIPDYNWNLSVSRLRSRGGRLECRLRSMSPQVLSWIQAILSEIHAKYPNLLQLVTITTSAGVEVLVVTVARWIPPTNPETIWSFWERYSDNDTWPTCGLPNNNLSLTEGGLVNVINPTQLLHDIYSPPLNDIRETVAYCRSKYYANISYHLDHRSAPIAEGIYSQWKRDVLWSRYRDIIVWIALYQKNRLNWNHTEEEGTFGVSWLVERWFGLPDEILRIIIKWM